MKRYPVHEDLKLIASFKPPVSPVIIPISNLFLKLFGFRGKKGITVEKLRIPRNDQSILTADLVSPTGAEGELPCLVYFHGGGFALRAAPYHYQLVKEYAMGANCRVLFVDYRLAPKHPFPKGAEDAYLAYSYALAYAESLKIDPIRIAVGGDSAGGCLAAACTLMARDRGMRLPCFQLLVYPVLDRRMQTDSMAKYPDTPMWNAVKNKMMWEMYLPQAGEIPIEYASPMEVESLEHLPPAYVETAEFDCLHDEGVLYAKRLIDTGIPVEVYETKGTVHGFDIIMKSDMVRACIKRRIAALKKAFYL